MKPDTICIQGGWKPKNGEPRQLPIYQSTTWRYATSEEMGKLFDLEASGYFYTRLQNPTNDVVADKIRELEGGVGAVLTSSGQAANFYAIFNIAQAGDHVLSTAAIYGGTSNLFTVTMRKMGIEVELVDQDLPEEEHGVPLIVDNTFPTPINCQPFKWGVDIVTHSTTKYMDGHACQTGGVIVDSGNFDWDAHADKFPGLTTPDESYHGLTYTKKFGKQGYTVKLVAQLMRDLGAQASPFSAFLLNLGLETLHLRMPRHCANALAVAKFLQSRPEVEWVNYPGLPDNRDHALAQKYMPNGTCGVIAFAVKGTREDAGRFIDRLKFVSIETHVADSRTCVLHPASHTHRQLSSQQLKEAGVPEGLIRLSCGIEAAEDIIADLEQAFGG